MSKLLWDNTLSWNAWFRDEITLPRFRAAGFTVVGLTIGGGSGERDVAIESIAAVRRLVEREPAMYRIVRGISDVDESLAAGQLALVLNFQGADPLENRIEGVEEFHALGVRQIGLVWNADNALGCSATTSRDTGLTSLGKAFVKEMNRAGVIIDGAHAGYQTTMDAMDESALPLIFSHANVDAILPSYKNLKDDQLRRCAQGGGVIGISGFGTYLDNLDVPAEAMFRQIDHVCELVGAGHVGLGLDFVRDAAPLWEKVRANPKLWPGVNESRFFPPEEVCLLEKLMDRAGYTTGQVAGILGDNWKRVSHAVWSQRIAPVVSA
jgi:membrane dipeptidase